MGKCNRCGYRRLGLVRSRCMVCGALVCENCQMIVGSMEGDLARMSGRSAGGYGSFGPVYHAACTWDCFDRWAWSFISREHAPKRFGPGYVLGGIRLHPAAAQRAVAMAEDHRRRQGLAHAQHLIEAEDHEGAAKIYQTLGMWKEAGEVRRSGRRQIVTQVHVNVNDLVDQVRKAGIVTDYTCPACRGHIPISGDTTLAKLRSCQYCGSAIQTTDLVEFLTRVVGYP